MTRFVIGVDPAEKTGVGVVTAPGYHRGAVQVYHHETLFEGDAVDWLERMLHRLGACEVRMEIEDQFLQHNPAAMKKVAWWAGEWRGAARHFKIPFDFISASKWRSLMLPGIATGTDRAILKAAAHAAVKMRWGLERKDCKIDAAEALLIAACAAERWTT